jgi:hypothetical protein
VSLLAKDLPSYTYVRETWLDHGGLPDVPWLAEHAPDFTLLSHQSPHRRLAGERRS